MLCIVCLARTPRARLKDKPSGLVVDYLGLGQALKLALATYIESGGPSASTRLRRLVSELAGRSARAPFGGTDRSGAGIQVSGGLGR